MTDVVINLARPGLGGPIVPAKGGLTLSLVQRQRSGDSVVTVQSFNQVLTDGVATVTLLPTVLGLNAWRVVENVPNGVTRWVQVPDSSTALKYADLSDVDPKTLTVTDAGLAAWTLAVNQANSAAAAAAASAQAASQYAAGSLQVSKNLSDVPSPSAARGNLGLGSAATQASGAFEAAGSVAALATSVSNTYVAFVKNDGTPLTGRKVIVKLTADQTDIADIVVVNA